MQKKKINFIPYIIFSVQYNISLTKELYVISLVKLHITDRVTSIILSMS